MVSDDQLPRRFTLMTVHAHPDDESIGTGGVMAKAVHDGHRVVLVTATRGEQGEIVVPEIDTPANHRRLGEIRMAELEDAMGVLGVTEWDNLGYHDSDMMGRPGNRDPRTFWQADFDEAVGRLVWFVRRHRPDVMTTYNAFGGYGHPDHVRVHDVSVAAFDRAGEAAWYPAQLSPEFGGTGPAASDGGLGPWTPRKLYEQVIPASIRQALNDHLASLGQRSFWMPPENATAEEIAEFEAFTAKALVPDDQVTTWVDVSSVIELKWGALRRHVTQISSTSGFMAFGLEGWRQHWSREAYILRAVRGVEATVPETDLFAGLA